LIKRFSSKIYLQKEILNSADNVKYSKER